MTFQSHKPKVRTPQREFQPFLALPQCGLHPPALGDFQMEFFVALPQLSGSFRHQFLEVIAVPFQFLFGPLPLGDVPAHPHNTRKISFRTRAEESC